ncbi:MAG: ATP-dependent DNA helicase [Salibacteraceae bacterium]
MLVDLHKSFHLSPTPDQALALDKLNYFINSSNHRQIFILRGFAGTGKTTLLAHVAKSLQKDNKVLLLAPTGRAAKVLSSYCEMPAFTVHKKIYWLAEGAEGEVNFVLQKNKLENTVFIVDESSMLSSGSSGDRDLLEDLMRFVYRNKGCRIIFSGDNAQLPPVHYDYSPALDAKFMEDRFNLPVHEVELDTVIRQKKDSGILANATLLRQLIQSNSTDITLTPNLVDILSINGMELQDCLEESISLYGIEEVLFVTRSNKRANQFNSEIRNRLLFREERVETGDLLMSVKNNYHWLSQEEKKDDFIANGESFEILKVLNRETIYGFDFADVNVRFVDDRIPDIDVKLWLDCLDAESPSLNTQDLRSLYFKVYEDYVAQGESKKAKQLTLNDPYYNAIQCKFSFAVTCHKAQGGQWEAVFVDHGYLTDEMVDESLLRWLYTAITRAKTKVFLVNFNENFITA